MAQVPQAIDARGAGVMVRDDGQRALLFELDARIRQVAQELGQAHDSVIGLTGAYHNLLRRWADA